MDRRIFGESCFWQPPFAPSICFDLPFLFNAAFAFVFVMGMIAGASAWQIWLRRKSSHQVRANPESGSVFFALFAAVAMIGVVGAGLNMVMRGPVKAMSEVTRHSIAENNMIASSRLSLMSAATMQPDNGDCDADGFVEPIPYRDAGAQPHPAGGGYLPTMIGATLTDPWQRQYGYCVWDHGPVTVSDNNAGCGGSSARRLNGAPTDTQYAVAIISAGKDRTFQTSCNAYVDANSDGVPDTPLLDKPAGSDDVVLGHTYAEANAVMGGLWNLKVGEPGTAEINKDIEVQGGGSFGGSLTLGGGLLLPDQTSSGACSETNDQQLRRNTAGDTPTLEICDWQGGSGDWTGLSGGTPGGSNKHVQYNKNGQFAGDSGFTYDGAGGLRVMNGTNALGVGLGTQGYFQAASDLAGQGFIDTPWIYARAIEADARNTASTLIAIGDSNGFTGQDQIGLVTNGGTRLMVDANGNVGIGTTSPTAKLHVVDASTTGATYGVYGQSKSTSGVGVQGMATAATGSTYGGYFTSSSTSGIGVNATGATGVHGHSSGASGQGIYGSSSGSSGRGVFGYAISTNGIAYGVYGKSNSPTGYGVYSDGQTYSTGALTVGDSVTATAYFQSSDRNLKTDIETIADPFALLNGVTGKHFLWKKGGKAAYGVIAQDVETVMPEAIGKNYEGFKTVEYSQLIAPLIEAVKQLDERVKTLEADNDNLRAENAVLKEGAR